MSLWRTLWVLTAAAIVALIVIVASVALYPRVAGGGVNPGEPGGPLFTARGSITVTSASGGGTLNVTVFNASNFPVSAIVVSKIVPSIPGIAGNVTFTYKGGPLDASNPEYIGGAVAEGVCYFHSGASIGTNYTATLQVWRSDGEETNQSVSMVAEG
jgi:hypothetical protein